MDLHLYDLRCAHTVCALGVPTEDPLFSWRLRNGERAEACRVRVWGSEGVLKDTGWIPCPGRMELRLGAMPLRPFFRYRWSVEVMDPDGAVARAESFFVMGIRRLSDWCGFFVEKIWKSTAFYYRTEFAVERPEELSAAYLFLAAQGSRSNAVRLSMNGGRIGDAVLFPGLMEYFHGVYTAFDVTDRLRAQNAMGAVVMRSFSVILSLEWKDGRREVRTFPRGAWSRIIGGGYTKLGYFDGFHGGKCFDFDARLEPEGFDLPGFDDSGWDHKYFDDFMVPGIIRLTPQLCRVTVRKEEKPRRITLCGDHYTVDFGQNGAGYVRFRLRGKKDQRIELRYSEKMERDGLDAWQTDLYPPYYSYTFARDGEVEFEPAFMHTGFRAVRVFGLTEPPTEENFTAVRIASEVESSVSEFTCSDPDILRILNTARESFVSNLVNVPTDCPERERRGWMGDAFAVCEAEFLMLDVRTFYAQWMESMRDSMRLGGWIPVEQPMSTDSHMDINWGAASVLVPWTVYEQTGDLSLLARTYPVSRGWVELLREVCDPDGGVSPLLLAYRDWVAIAQATGDYLGRCYAFRCADLTARMAAALGLAEDAKAYGEYAAFLRERLNERYLVRTPDGGVSYDNGSQSALAHALRFGVVPEELRGALCEALANRLAEEGRSTSGFLGAACLLNALTENGRQDVAYRMLKNEREGGWLWLLNNCDATTFPECWNGSGSQNHAFLGSAPVEFFCKGLCGVVPAEPGYARVRIAPFLPEGLASAGCRLLTAAGEIRVRWEQTAEDARLTLSLAQGITAEVVFGDLHETVQGEKVLTLRK